MATAIVQVRVDEELKRRADRRLKRMGLNLSAAVNLLLNQIDVQGRIPFSIVDRADADTLEAIEEVKRMKANPDYGKSYASVQEMMKDVLQ